MNRTPHTITLVAVSLGIALGAAGYALWPRQGHAPTEERAGVFPSPVVDTPDLGALFPGPSPTPGAVQTLSDVEGIFSATLPRDWKITRNEGRKGVQLARIDAESPDYRERVDASAEGPFTPIYYEAGGAISMRALRRGDGTPFCRDGSGVIRSETVTVDGVKAVYRVFKEPSTFAGQIVDAALERNGVAVVITLRYNPETFPQGETLFRDVLASFRFQHN